MKKLILFLITTCMCMLFTACNEKTPPAKSTEQEMVEVEIEAYLEPQIQAYRDAFGFDDISVDVQITEYDIQEPVYGQDLSVTYPGFLHCTIRDIVVWPSMGEKLKNNEFTDELLHKLTAIDFSYPDEVHTGIPYGDYMIDVYSRLAYPIIDDGTGAEYVVACDVVVKDDVFVYISPNANLDPPAKVGDQVADFSGAGSSFNGSGLTIPGEKCPNCNGSGYVKYRYGDSDLQAYLEGYPPYTVGECPVCDGKGY